MRPSLRSLIVLTTLFAAGGGSAAAQSGPGLSETLQFLRDKLAAEGKVNYAASLHDSKDGQDWVNQLGVEATDVTFDASICRISFHWRTEADGKVVYDGDSGLPFDKVERVTLTSMEDDLNRINADAGHPTWTARINPPVWVVIAHRATTSNTIDFRDRDTAERVVRAMTHAADLCGGTKSQPF